MRPSLHPSFHLATSLPITSSHKCFKKPYNTPKDIFRAFLYTSSLITIRGSWLEPSDNLNLSLLLIFLAIFLPHTHTHTPPNPPVRAHPPNLCIIPIFPLRLLPPAPALYLHLIACNGGRLRRQIGAIQYSSIWAELLICHIHLRAPLIGLMVWRRGSMGILSLTPRPRVSSLVMLVFIIRWFAPPLIHRISLPTVNIVFTFMHHM